MNDMSDIVFKTTEDQQNFEKAKKRLNPYFRWTG